MTPNEEPKWLRKLQKYMGFETKEDRKKLKKTLRKLKEKAKELKQQIDAETDEQRKAELISQWELIILHRKKGVEQLEQMKAKKD